METPTIILDICYFWNTLTYMEKMGRRLVNCDTKSDVLYIAVKKDMEEEFVEVATRVNVELDDRGEVIRIEVLNASKF